MDVDKVFNFYKPVLILYCSQVQSSLDFIGLIKQWDAQTMRHILSEGSIVYSREKGSSDNTEYRAKIAS